MFCSFVLCLTPAGVVVVLRQQHSRLLSFSCYNGGSLESVKSEVWLRYVLHFSHFFFTFHLPTFLIKMEWNVRNVWYTIANIPSESHGPLLVRRLQRKHISWKINCFILKMLKWLKMRKLFNGRMQYIRWDENEKEKL